MTSYTDGTVITSVTFHPFPHTSMILRIGSTIGSLGLLLALPAFALAQTAVTEDAEQLEKEILDIIDEQPAMPAPMPIADGKGGGGASMMYPGPMGGIQVDTSVTKEVTPDFIAVNAYCDIGKQASREAAREMLQKLFLEIKQAVGSDGVVRRTGGVGIYPFYDPTGQETGQYSGNLSLLIRVTTPAAAQRIFEMTEEKNCGPSWDVRLVDTQKHEMKVIDELANRLQKRKAIFEKLLNRRLTQVVSASLYTWVDGYMSYDPEKNTAEAMTTLSVSFDPGTRAMIRSPQN